MTRRSLLASLMALSLLCGGLGVASAADGTVNVDESTPGTAVVYTKEGTESYVQGELSHYAKASDTFTKSQTFTQDQVRKLINDLKTGDVATNRADITALQSELGNKADKSTVEAALDGKANKADVYSRTEVDTAVANAVTTAGTNVDNKLTDYYNKAAVDGKIAAEATARDTAINTAITLEKDARRTAIETAINGEVGARNQAIHTAITQEVTARDLAVTNAKTELQGKITEEETARKAADVELTGKITAEETARTNADNALDNRLTTAEGKIGANETAIGDLKAKDTVLEGKITTLDGKVTTDIADLKAKDIDLEGKIQTNANNIQTNKNDITTIKQRTAGIDRIDATNETTIEGNVTVDNLGNVTAEGKLKGAGLEAGAVNAGSLQVDNASHLKGEVTMDKTLSVTGDTKLGALNVTGESSLKDTQVNGTLTTTGKATFKEAVEMDKGLTVTSGDTTLQNTDVKGALNVTGESSLKNTTVGGTLGVTGETTLNDKLTVKGEATFKDKVTMDKDLEVKGELKTDKIAMENKKTDADGRHNSSTAITADYITHIGEVENSGVITKSSFTHNEKGTINYAKDGDTADWKETRSYVTASGVSNKMTDSDKNKHTYSQTATESKEQLVNGDKSKSNFEKKTAEGNTISITEKDAAGNVVQSLTNKQTVKGEKTSVTNEDSSSIIKQEADQIRHNVTSADGKKSSIEVKAEGITNTSKDGTITNTAKNVTNEGTESVTNKVGANEVKVSTNGVDITAEAGKKITESVGTASRVVENDKITDKAADSTVTTENGKGTTFGKEGSTGTTNIYGDSIRTGTINAEDTTTAKLTAGAAAGAEGGRLTVDANDGVKGSYKSGKYTSKSYILANTLKSGVDNGKDPTDTDFVGSRTDHYMDGDKAKLGETVKDAAGSNVTNKTSTGTATTITDGNGKTSATIQDVKNLAGSVTNGTETGVSGIHANDDGSVSIDSAVAGGSSISTINQKKDSITSQVTDGITITKTEQGAKDITNTATAGTITNDAKDIVNKAQNTITNTAGTSITNQVKDSKVTTDVDGTTFENKTAAVSDGGATTTKINGNQITTGRVDANELGVSDKDGANTADFSVEAGEGKGVNGSAGNGTTTGSLDVTAEEVSSSVKDASGKGSTFKQRIDKIMMESKDVSIKAEETLTNEAKVITNKASEVINNEAVNINNTATGIITSKASEIKNQADKLISNKVGENTWENMENGKITTSIKDGAKQNLTQSNAAGTTQSTVDVGKSTVTIQNADGLVDVVTDGTNTSVQNQTASQIAADVKDGAGNENASVANATTSANTIKSGSKANTVISTADGTSFINSEAAAPVTGASGAGTAVNTTIKGNTITTGKVTMDYAEVMKDLGVRGNANITGKTTTGSLEVTGTSTLKGDVTMESNATVNGNFSVGGNTNLKNTEVDGTLNVTQKATFGDSVSIAKDLSVGGDVTANSYKVGDKTYIDANGINANDQKITNVADGSISEGSKDAVNGGQLYGVKRDLEHQVDKVGANAAAMANLRPMEFDPSSKWNIAAAIGNYGSETAAALGAFYRPNDDVMVNLSTAFGTGENMVGGGVSVRLGKGGNKLSREENNALKDQVNDLTARMDALLSVLNPNMSKDFPDVPENHWAYEAVSRLAGNDIVQGYPDGEFHGERTMTRYEMAEIIYNALSRGAEAEKELVEEFKPELQAMAASEKATAEKAEG